MKAYIIVTYEKIDSQETLKKYTEFASIALKKYSVNILVRGGKSDCLEGKNIPRTVILEFPNIDAAKEFYNSTEYQKAVNVLDDTIKRNYQIVEGS